MKLKPITKLFLLCATLLTLFISTFVLIDKTFKKINTCSDRVAIYNDSILTIKGEFNKYLIHDDININNLNRTEYINNSNTRLDSLNHYIKSDEIKELAKRKEFFIKSLVMKSYKVKETYGVIKYEVTKGSWIFKKTSTKKIIYKKIDRTEIENLNKTEFLNKNIIYKYNINNDKINLRLNEIVTNKINELQVDKSNLLKIKAMETKNIITLLEIIAIVTIVIIISLLLSIIRDIRYIMRKNNMDKVTLSFLVDYIKENKNHS